jgi:hypothetical protein
VEKEVMHRLSVLEAKHPSTTGKEVARKKDHVALVSPVAKRIGKLLTNNINVEDSSLPRRVAGSDVVPEPYSKAARQLQAFALHQKTYDKWLQLRNGM